MNRKKKIIFTITNDIVFDQRMMRICTALDNAGYEVTLVGWKWGSSMDLMDKPYNQKRIPVPFRQGKIMYIYYWIRLFIYLLTTRVDAVCAIDLDTIVPVYWATFLKRKCKRVYDAHEIFTEMQEVNSRPGVKKLWEWIGQKYVPLFPTGYTISPSYARFFRQKYNVDYGIVRNATVLKPFTVPEKKERYILYQGAVNEGRAFEYLIPAMREVDCELVIIGRGNFTDKLQRLIAENGVESRVKMLGYKRPDELKQYTEQAWIGITLFDDSKNGLSNYLSMANRFFDYMHHGVPQLACDFPEYKLVNQEKEIAYLVKDLTPAAIAVGLNMLLTDEHYHRRLSENAMIMREKYCWQEEEKSLVRIYQDLFRS